MKLTRLPAFRPDGRLRGAYVYLLLCREGDAIFAKAGRAQDPISRARDLLVGCPLAPGVLAVAELPSRPLALRAENALHRALERWHARGEWYRFGQADRAAFNDAWRAALAEFASPSWPIRWTKLSMPALIRYGNSASSFRLMLQRRSACPGSMKRLETSSKARG